MLLTTIVRGKYRPEPLKHNVSLKIFIVVLLTHIKNISKVPNSPWKTPFFHLNRFFFEDHGLNHKRLGMAD